MKDYDSIYLIKNKKYMRIQGEELANTTVEVIASGGGNDFGKLSAYGAEISAIKSVSKYLSPFGFEKVE